MSWTSRDVFYAEHAGKILLGAAILFFAAHAIYDNYIVPRYYPQQVENDIKTDRLEIDTLQKELSGLETLRREGLEGTVQFIVEWEGENFEGLDSIIEGVNNNIKILEEGLRHSELRLSNR
jgi:hypothetical protein